MCDRIRRMNNMRIVFMGSPDFAVPSLEALAERTNVVGVVTQPDRPAGRGKTFTPPPVKIAAETLNLPVIQPEKLKEPGVFEALTALEPDMIIVAAYGQILRRNILELPRFGCVNVHASLLPRWRGAAPIQAAIMAGDPETGVTIMKMAAGLDTGDMISRRSIPIKPTDTAGSLTKHLSTIGAELLLDTLPEYVTGKILPQPQNDELATYAGMIKKEEGLLDLTVDAEYLERQVRAFSPWPSAFILWQGEPLKIHRAHVVPGRVDPGKRSVINKIPAVGTASGWLVLDDVQPAGKKIMPGQVFLNGARNWSEEA